MNNQIPQNVEYEKSLIGTFFYASSFVDQQDIYDRVISKISEADFYDVSTKAAFKAIGQLIENRIEIDSASLITQLEKDNVLNANQIATLISEVQVAISTTANVDAYANDIRETSIARNLIDLMNRTNQAAHDPSSNPDDLIAQVRSTLDNIESNREDISFTSVRNALEELIQEITEAEKNKSELKPGAIPSGFPKLDRLTKGLQKSNLVILAARPAVGKTAFALNLARNAAASKEIGKKAVVIFNLEMNESSMMLRLLSSQSSVPMNQLQTGNDLKHATSQNDAQAEWSRILEANRRLSSLNIQINATPGIAISEIRSTLRSLDKQLKHDNPEGGVGLVVIDYLQLIEPEGNSNESRQNEISKISRSLKKLSSELDIPVVALSQLSRGVESRVEKKPMLSDLRDSGAIEQDADIVMFLYREDYYDKNGNREGEEGFNQTETPNNSEVQLIVAKNRQGANDTVNLVFIRDIQKYAPREFGQQPQNNRIS